VKKCMAMNGDYVEKCVQCGRELNFLHSDITVIILHGQILILHNWRPYLSITPRISVVIAEVVLEYYESIVIFYVACTV